MRTLLLAIFFLSIYIYSGDEEAARGYKILHCALLALLILWAVWMG